MHFYLCVTEESSDDDDETLKGIPFMAILTIQLHIERYEVAKAYLKML